MSLYRQDSEDSFEDFLEWRRWKRERATGGEAQVKAPASRTAAAPKQIVGAPMAAAPIAASKGKEEARSTPSAASKAPVPVPVPVAVPASSEKVAIPSATTAAAAPLSEHEKAAVAAGDKWAAEFASLSEKEQQEKRAFILTETKAFLAAGSYTSLDGSVVELDVTGADTGRVVVTGEEAYKKPATPYNTTAHFVKSDAIDTALFLIEKRGVNPLVVVSVDPLNMGEGFPGSSSLEEQTYRRTTLSAALDGDFKYAVPEKGAIYLPSVQVFRDSELKNGYQLLKAPRKVAFLLASSVSKPSYEQKGRSFILAPDQAALLTAKLRTILATGVNNGHDAIVLSAFGCGYNQTPPQVTAAIVRDLITTEFAQAYKHVTFAILEDSNCGKPHNLNGNLVPFQQEFLLMEKSDAGCGCTKKK